MRTLFADAHYWIALLSPRDQLHQKALRISQDLGESRIVTSEMVLCEVLNMFSGEGPHLRRVAAELVQQLTNNSNVDAIPQSHLLFERSLKLYSERGDKRWGITDCSSFLIMEDKGITEALTADKDFEQAGFTALL